MSGKGIGQTRISSCAEAAFSPRSITPSAVATLDKPYPRMLFIVVSGATKLLREWKFAAHRVRLFAQSESIRFRAINLHVVILILQGKARSSTPAEV